MYTRTTTTLKPLKSTTVTFLWADDGWCYIPKLGIRQKFTVTDYQFQKWEGIIPIPLYMEEVVWKLYSESPRIWSEGNDTFMMTS